MMKKNLSIGLVILIVVLSFSCLYFRPGLLYVVYDMAPCRQKLFKETKDKLKRVKAGMTKDQVREIMGSPINVSEYKVEGQAREVWYFPDSRLASEPSRCIFDKSTGQVVIVVSGDDYYVEQR